MMAKYKRNHLLASLLATALLCAWLSPLPVAADDGAAAAEPAAGAAAQPQVEGVAPQVSGGAATAPSAATTPVAGADAGLPSPVLTPMQAEIAQLLSSEQAKVADLQQRLIAAKGSPTAMELHKQVQDTKLQTQVAILQVQVRYARAEGRELVAEQLETAIRDMTTPKAPGKPIDRPAPTQAPASGAQQQ